MNCSFKYLNASNIWVTYGRLVTPVNFGDLIKNEVTTSYAVRLYFSGSTEIIKPALTPGTICKLDFGTKEFQFVIIDGGKIANKNTNNYCYHSYTIQELLAYTREIFVQNAFFTAGLYTVPEFLERLIALSETDRTIVIDETGDYQVVVDNWKKVDFQVSSNSLLDNLINFGKLCLVRIKARINSSGQLELFFKDLNGSETIDSINGQLVNEDDKYLGVNYASRVMSLASNLTDGGTKWYPNESVFRGLMAEPDGDSFTITPDSAVIKLPFKIKNAVKLRALGLGKIVTNSNGAWIKYIGQDYRVFYPDGTRINAAPGKYVVVDDSLPTQAYVYGEMDIVEETNWKNLDPDGSDGATVHRENTLYFKQEDNKIYNIKQFDGGGDELQKFGADYICYVEVYDTGGSYLHTDYIYPKFEWENNKYIVLADLYTNTLISQSNNLKSKRTTIYSQNDNVVSANALSVNLKNHIESMENTDEAKVYRFNSINDIPEVGQIFNGKIISQIINNAYYDKIESTLTFSDGVVGKSEYINANAGLDLPVIDINKAYDRYTNYKTVIWFCENYAEALEKTITHGIDSYFVKPGYLANILSAIKNNRSSTLTTFAEAELKFGDFYTSIAPELIIANNTLLVVYKTKNNLSVGTRRDTSIGTGYADIRFLPAFFAGTDKHDIMYMKFKTARPSGLDDYPMINQTEFDSNSGLIASIYDDKYHRDPQEVVNINLQLEAKTTMRLGKVNDFYWKESDLIKDFLFSDDEYTRIFTFYYINPSTGVESTTFGTDREVGDVTVSYLSGESICKVDIELYPSVLPVGFSIPPGFEQNSYIEISRIHNITLDKELMLKTRCELTGTNPYFITYYVAFTK